MTYETESDVGCIPLNAKLECGTESGGGARKEWRQACSTRCARVDLYKIPMRPKTMTEAWNTTAKDVVMQAPCRESVGEFHDQRIDSNDEESGWPFQGSHFSSSCHCGGLCLGAV